MLPPKATKRAWFLNGAAVIAEAAMAFVFFAVLIPVRAAEAALLPVLAPSLWFCAALAYAFVTSRWIRPARDLLRRGPDAGAPTPAQREAARTALVLHPRRTLLLRLSLWVLFGLAATVWLNVITGFPLRAFASIAFALGIPGIIFGTFHAMWLREASRPLLAEIDPEAEPARSYVESLDDLLNISAAACGSLGALFVTGFFHYFLDFTVERMRTIWRLFPYFVVMLTIATSYATQLFMRGPQRFLAALARHPPGPLRPDTPSESDEDGIDDRFRFRTTPVPPAPTVRRLGSGGAEMHRRLQRLPYVTATMTFVTWFVAIVAAVLHAANMWQFAVEDMVLVLVVGLVTSSAVATYQIQWHRALVRPALNLLTTRIPIHSEHVTGRLGLRGKIIVAYVVVAAFAVALSLIVSLVQLRRWNTREIALGAKARADEILTSLREERSGRDMALRPEEALRRITLSPNEWIFFRPDNGVERWVDGLAPEPRPVFSVDVVVGFDLAPTDEGGILDMRAAQLAGWFFPVPEAKGVLGVLHPGYRAGGLGSRILTSVVFFVTLLGICLGIVFLAAREIAIPIVRLSLLATRIEGGDLAFRIGMGEGDEIGRLAGALDQMRDGLARQIALIDDLNASLEQKVQARTSELQQRSQELAAAYGSLQEAQAQLVHSEKMASLGQLAAGVAHEINNPLNALANSIDPLARVVEGLTTAGGQTPDAETTEELRSMLRVIRSAASRAQGIVTDLLLFARPGDDQPSVVDLRDGIRETLELVGHRTRNRIEVALELEDVGPVTCYPGPLNQVFMNLTLNAVQAVESVPEPRVEISLRRSPEPETVLFCVRDNGPGIAPDAVPRIFDPFFTTKPPGEGTGLGLSISHQIVERHHGSIEVQTAPGNGAAFTVHLPTSLAPHRKPGDAAQT